MKRGFLIEGENASKKGAKISNIHYIAGVIATQLPPLLRLFASSGAGIVGWSEVPAAIFFFFVFFNLFLRHTL